MNNESARQGALPNYRQTDHRPLASPDRQRSRDACRLPDLPHPRRSGPAVLRKDGKSYVTDRAEYDGHAIEATVQLRHRDLQGERLYPPRSILWPVTRVEIEWLGVDQ
jgi:hypothetical protein